MPLRSLPAVTTSTIANFHATSTSRPTSMLKVAATRENRLIMVSIFDCDEILACDGIHSLRCPMARLGSVEYRPDHPCQLDFVKRLLQKRDPRLQNFVLNHHVVRIAGHV